VFIPTGVGRTAPGLPAILRDTVPAAVLEPATGSTSSPARPCWRASPPAPGDSTGLLHGLDIALVGLDPTGAHRLRRSKGPRPARRQEDGPDPAV